VSSRVLRRKYLRCLSSGSTAATEEVVEGRSSIGVNQGEEAGWAIVGVLRDAKPKRGAKVSGGAGSSTIRQAVVKCGGRKKGGTERAYLFGSFYLFCLCLFIYIMYSLLRDKNSHAALAMA